MPLRDAAPVGNALWCCSMGLLPHERLVKLGAQAARKIVRAKDLGGSRARVPSREAMSARSGRPSRLLGARALCTRREEGAHAAPTCCCGAPERTSSSASRARSSQFSFSSSVD